MSGKRAWTLDLRQMRQFEGEAVQMFVSRQVRQTLVLECIRFRAPLHKSRFARPVFLSKKLNDGAVSRLSTCARYTKRSIAWL